LPIKEGVLPTKPALDVKPPGLTLADLMVERQDAELTAAGRELAEDLGTWRADEFSSPGERRAAERPAGRRQTEARAASNHHREARVPQARVVPGAGASMLPDAVPAALIALIAGSVLGLLLGALSFGGWVIGLLVAGLTVAVLRTLGPHSGSTRARNQ
jgi:hypothetical protein